MRSDQPDNAWALLENTSPSLEVKPATNCVTEEDPVPGGHFRVVVISDTHGLHADIPHVPDGEVKRTSLTPRENLSSLDATPQLSHFVVISRC